jgi:HAD superfamily hydrolase (TIGR01509 family)
VPISAVIFDIGGVLEVNPPTGWQQRWAARLDLDVAQLDRRLGPILDAGSRGAATLPTVERVIATVLGLEEPALCAFMADLWAEYLGTPNAPLARWFAGLRPRYRTGILSNSFVGAREREQRLYGFQDMCDVVVYSHEEGCLKPDPRLYGIVCERLAVAPEHAVFVDDVPECVEGARAVGMRAIRFLDNHQVIRDLHDLLGLTL